MTSSSLPSIVAVVRESAVLVAEPERKVVRVRGPDARTWLNGVVTCDVAQVTAERGTYGFLLSKQGKIQAQIDVVAAPDGLFLGVRAMPGIEEVLDRYLIMEDAELSAEPDLVWLRLHGAEAVAAAGRVPSPLGRGAIDWLGVGGAALVVPKRDLAAVLSASGARVADEAGEEWALLRIAFGFPCFGLDYRADEANPHEVSLERRAISWSKGCYLGQEVVCMQDMRGKVKRRVVPLRVDGGASLEPPLEVQSAEPAVPAGSITTSASEGDVTLAFARLSSPFFEGNHELSVAGRPARIVRPNALEDGTFSD